MSDSWLSGPWRSSVYSRHLFLISSASIRSIPFLSFIEPIFAWDIPLVSLIFLKRSLVFPILSSSSISLHWSLRKDFLSLLAILWNSAFRWIYFSFSRLPFASLLFSAIGKASSARDWADQSLWGLWVLVCTRFCLSPLSISGQYGVLILNMILPLIPSCWGFSFTLGCGVSFFSGIQRKDLKFSCQWLFSSELQFSSSHRRRCAHVLLLCHLVCNLKENLEQLLEDFRSSPFKKN